MKHSKIYTLSILILALLPFVLTNCEEVMKDFELKKTQAQIVIDAQCSSFTNTAIVKITKTGDYMNPGEYPKVSDAIVTLSFNDTTIVLPEEFPGEYYKYHNFPENTLYTISVTIDSKVYTAQSFMPKKVKLTNLSYRVSEYSSYMQTYPGELFYVSKMEFLDPQDETNYYRIKITKNDTLFKSANDMLLTDDVYFNADTIEYEPFYFFKTNDRVTFEFMSIDKANYLYYTTLVQAMTSTGNFSVPDNPTSNFTGNILGRFIAYSSDTLSIRIEE